jgi:hypothetical protein
MNNEKFRRTGVSDPVRNVFVLCALTSLLLFTRTKRHERGQETPSGEKIHAADVIFLFYYFSILTT